MASRVLRETLGNEAETQATDFVADQTTNLLQAHTNLDDGQSQIGGIAFATVATIIIGGGILYSMRKTRDVDIEVQKTRIGSLYSQPCFMLKS